MGWSIVDRLRNLYFRRLFVSYTIITVAVSCLCGAILYDKARQVTAGDLYATGQNRLNQMKSYMEETYPAIFKNAFISNMLSTVDLPSGSDDAFSTFYKEYGSNVYQIFRLADYLKGTVEANEGVDSISIYFKSANMMVNQYAFYRMAENSPKYDLLTELDQGRLQTDRWIARTVPYGNEAAERLLTYIYSFPLNAPANEAKGYMFIDLKSDHLGRMLDSQLQSPDEKLLMYDRSSGYAAYSGNVTERDEGLLRNMLIGEASSVYREGGIYFSALKQTDLSGGWAFASARPVDSIEVASGSMQRQIFLVSLSVLLFGVAASYAVAVMTYNPVQRMLQKLKESGGVSLPGQQRNEFSLFEHVLAGLNNRIRQLAGQLNEEKLLALLNGRLDADELPEPVPADSLYMAVKVKLAGTGGKTGLTRLHKQAALCPHTAIHTGPSELCMLYYSDELPDKKRQIGQFWRQAAASSRTNESLLSVGIGSIAHAAEDIAKSYGHAAAAAGYTFIQGLGTAIDYDDIISRSSLPSVRFEPFENALRAGDTQSVGQFIDEFGAAMKQAAVSLEGVELSLMQMTVTLSKVIVDMNSKEQMFPNDYMFKDVRMDTIDETLERIRERSLQIADHIGRHLLRSTQYDVITRLKAYIDDHLEEDISLDRLSAMAGLSTHYVSKQFKELLHVSFVDYLTGARMDKACELLRGAGLSVTDISAKVGYGNVQYFCNKFKSRYGVTPNQFRKSYSGASVEALR
ncbi:helix-turn-helix domain-containing protein [Paenibacillus mesophilus]|uniref:helix-turn-helix domain-containing protein n=1 Tax=Paenibacillus mesophilus TaxID=2582849 RepID=UPI00130513E8|nr:AraC family transcriptional regulator [Paenibacillus mesophilus]